MGVLFFRSLPTVSVFKDSLRAIRAVCRQPTYRSAKKPPSNPVFLSFSNEMAQISSSEQPNMKQVDLTTLNIQQLSTLKQQLDQELTLFQDSLTSLKVAQTKFQNSGEALEKVSPESENKDILVPLTGSMYVPGELHDTNNVLIDIGTRYYAEKDVGAAKDYFKRKIQFVTEQMEKIQYLGLEKSKIRDTIVEIIEMKLQ